MPECELYPPYVLVLIARRRTLQDLVPDVALTKPSCTGWFYNSRATRDVDSTTCDGTQYLQ